MRNLCPWRTKAAFIDSYCYPPCEQSSWEGKDVYRLSRCSSGTQPSMCLSCYWEIGKLNQQCVNCLGTSDCESMHLFKFMTFKEHVVNPEPSSSFTVTKKKEIISQCILYIYTWHGFLEVHNPNVLSQPFFVWFSECSNFPWSVSKSLCWKVALFFNRSVGAAFSNSCRLSFQPAVVMVVQQANLGFFSNPPVTAVAPGTAKAFGFLDTADRTRSIECCVLSISKPGWLV